MTHQGQLGVYFDSEGFQLLGTLFLARGDDPKPTAILLHGIPGIEKNFDLAIALREHGYNCLIFHYRGCWGSDGIYNLESIPLDVGNALSEMCSDKYKQIDPQRMLLIGHSLGGWAAVLVGARDKRVKAVAAIAPLTDPTGFPITTDIAARLFCPWLPGLSPEDLVDQWMDLDDTYMPLRQVSKVSPKPLLIIEGAEDVLIPHQAKPLYEAAGQPKELLVHPEANHTFTWHRSWLQNSILNWLKQTTI